MKALNEFYELYESKVTTTVDYSKSLLSSLKGMFDYPFIIRNDGKGNPLYKEDRNGNWEMYIYEDGKLAKTITNKDNHKFDKKQTLAQHLSVEERPLIIRDSFNNMLYFEDNRGFWYKRDFDKHGNITKFENSDGDWYTKEYDSKGKLLKIVDENGEKIK